MESNQLGNSIVKAAWILFFAAFICTLIYTYTNKYTPLGDRGIYINQITGDRFLPSGKKID